jgi:uncharacterized membrane protein YjjP (DUF1212 family)
MKILQYNKFIVAILGAVSAGLTTWANGAHWADTLIAGITAILVYLVPNAPKPAVPVPTVPPTTPGTYSTTVVTPVTETQTPNPGV